VERTLISWNVPNLITVPLMAFLGFLLLGVAWQVGVKVMGGGSQAEANNSGGF
jgi:hypothetical protein